MSNTAKLKKKAAEFEARKQYEKALELYEQVLNGARASDEERDVPLYNRVGDIHYRIGNNDQAINYYEQAADLYAEGGFFNNAIALCNKILRYSPGRTIIYYKLGIISAKKGFNSDAKQNFLEYADRMQRVGKMDEAFRALKEFADLCPGQDDVRLMLAEQLARADRKTEALEQLEILYDTLEAEGRVGEAAATVERMKTLDPTFKPRRSATPRPRKKEGLVFLDLDFDTPTPPAETPLPIPDDEDGPSPGAKTHPAKFEIQGTAKHEAEAVQEISRPAEASRADESPVAPEGLELTSMRDAETVPEAEIPSSITDEQISAQSEPEPSEGEDTHASNELRFITPDVPERDPQIIQFPVGRTPAGSTPGIRTPNGTGPLSGLDIIGDIGSSSNESVADSSVAPDDDFIDLGEWLERNRTPASTRMVAHDEVPENN
ncbi:MAG TPA: tetratricopeptide repeat protein [Gemmatimonadaceae bacterium]|nr:tetratricopeptide repeat protein [Gemmatimonadaceae bacterium]